jgi:hypothetical protein
MYHVRNRRRATIRGIAAAGLATLLTVGCASVNRNPPRAAEMLSVERLAGRWEGTYRARTVDRDGSFRLELEQRGESLTGWLDLNGVMAEPGRAIRTPTTPGGDTVRVTLASVTIDGIRARIRSNSYVDPGCGCALTLDLTGFVVADTLSGYFDAIGTAVTAPERGGRWRAVRVR